VTKKIDFILIDNYYQQQMNSFKHVSLISVFFFSFTPVAIADLVFMKESQSGKSVFLQKSEGQNTVQLNHSPDKMAIYPDISPDGKHVAYVEGPSPQNLQLVYRNLETQEERVFSSPRPGMVLHPKFTRNGKLLFFSMPGPRGKNTIAFLDPSKAQSLSDATVIDSTEESYFPRPSSDGNFVVYQRNLNGKKEIVIYHRIDSEKTVLAEGMSPALSFDEQQIAYTSKQNQSWDVFTIQRKDKTIRQITNEPTDEMAPTFQLNGNIAFASNKSGHYRLYSIDQEIWKPLLNASTPDDADYYSPQFTGNTEFKQDIKAAFIGNPRSSFGTVFHQGRLYQCGGHQGAEHTYPPESFSDQFQVYDPTLNQWTVLPPRPVKAHGYQLAAFGKYIYAFGGFAYSEQHKPRWKSLKQIDRYDTESGTWETIGELLTPRSSNVAVTIGHRVYLAAGWDSTPRFENDRDGTFLETIEIFDLETEKTSLADFQLPSPLRRALTGIQYEGKILLIGGLGQGASHFELINHVTAIDPETGKSAELSPLPFATFAPAAEVIHHQLYVFGGMFKMSETNYDYVSHIYQMNLQQGTWSHTGRYLQETKGFSQVFKLNHHTLGILGGHHYFEGYDLPVNTFETFSSND